MAVSDANVAAGSLSPNTATIPEDLAQQALAAITLALLDIQNQRAVFEADDQSDVTVTFTDGSTYSGPGFRRIAYLAENGDVKKLANIGLAVQANQAAAEAAQTAAEAAQVAAQSSATSAAASEGVVTSSAAAAAASETAAKTAETNAETSAAAASTSETNAAASETAAATSQANASGSANTAKASETAAAASAAAAKISETNAAASATAAAASETNARASAATAVAARTATETARDLALTYSGLANDARNEAATSADLAEGYATSALNEADRAKTEADRAGNASKFTNAINVDDTTNVVDFVEPPTINGIPIVASTTQGESHFHTDLMCKSTDNLNDDSWAGKTFMVEKPTISGTADAPISSNNAPPKMVYAHAVCTDFYTGWTPSKSTPGDQRVQMIYDEESIWIRGYHQETKTWTGWKRIASQLKTDVSNTDLNNLTLTGHYSYKTALNAPVIDASEASAVYFLDVFSTDGNDVYQVMHSPQTNSSFDRYRVGGVWSRWWNTTATFDVDTAAAGVDLNTITNPGWWGIPLDTALNLPNGSAYPPSKTGQGILEVIGISNGATIQRMHYVDDGDVYYRHRVASNGATLGAWSAWKVEFHFDENRVLPIANGGTGANTLAGAQAALGINQRPLISETMRILSVSGSPTAPTDINTLTGSKAGIYSNPRNDNTYDLAAPTDTTKIGQNYPTRYAGTLVVIKNNATNVEGCTQLYYPYHSNSVFYLRVYDAGTSRWSGWESFTSDGGLRDKALRITYAGGEDISIRRTGENQASYFISRTAGTDQASQTRPGAWYVGNPSSTGTQIGINAYGQGSLFFDINGSTGKSNGIWNCFQLTASTPASGSLAASTSAIYFKSNHEIHYNCSVGGMHRFNASMTLSGGINLTGQIATSSSIRMLPTTANKAIFYQATYSTATTLNGRLEWYGVDVAGNNTRSDFMYFDVVDITKGEKTVGTTKTGSKNNPTASVNMICRANTHGGLWTNSINVLTGSALTISDKANIFWGPKVTIGTNKAAQNYLGQDGAIVSKAFGPGTNRYRSINEWANATYAKASDPRVKRDIKAIELDDALQVVRNSKTYQWKWKENGQTSAGFLGTDAAIKGYTHNLGDITLNGGEQVKDCIGLDSAGVGVAVLIPVVKNLLEKIEALETKVAALESK